MEHPCCSTWVVNTQQMLVLWAWAWGVGVVRPTCGQMPVALVLPLTQNQLKPQMGGALNRSPVSLRWIIWGHSEAQWGARSQSIYCALTGCWALLG